MWLLEPDDKRDTARLRQVMDVDVQASSGANTPLYRYAALSHRWEDGDEEISFDDVTAGSPSRKKKGWYKYSKCQEQAKADGLDHVWIDTCCIDKRSSAELQEAINSMYDIYERATVCYVYMRDVLATHFDRTFRRSEWFYRKSCSQPSFDL